MDPKKKVQDWDTKERFPKTEKQKKKYKLLIEMLYFIWHKDTEMKGLLNKSVRHTHRVIQKYFERISMRVFLHLISTAKALLSAMKFPF